MRTIFTIVTAITLLFVVVNNVNAAATYFISPDGIDTNSGTSQINPIKTFNRAWELLYPGDTLYVMDGLYKDKIQPNRRNGRPNGIPYPCYTNNIKDPDCIDSNNNQVDDRDEPENTAFIPYDDPNRTVNYIKIKALHDGGATIDGEFARTPVMLGQVWPGPGNPVDSGEVVPVGNYFSIEGIIGRNGFTTTITTSGHHNVLKRISSYNTDSRKNNHGISAGTGSVHNLIEDCISAGSARKSVFAYASNYTIIRRIFAYWQEWDGRLQMGTEWPWGNAAEMYNSSNGIIENVMAIGSYHDVALNILSNMSTTVTPMGASNNKILGSAVIDNGMFPDGTAIRWPMARPLEPDNNRGPLKRYWEWPDQHVSVKMGTWGPNASVNNNLIRDVFAINSFGLGLSSGYDADDTFTNNAVDRITLINSKQNTVFPDSLDGIKGTDVISDRVVSLPITNSRIGRICSEAAKTTVNGCTSMNGEGARLANRYINGVLTAEPLWPWPMQDRIAKEIGYDITGTMTDVFIDNNTPTGNNLKAPVISPRPPIGSPLLNIPGTTYLAPVTVTMSLPEGAQSIRYTLDGSMPDSSSTLYTGPFNLDRDTYVKAVAFTGSGQASQMRSYYYRITPGGTNNPPQVTAYDGFFVSPYTEIMSPANSVLLYGTIEDYTLPQGDASLTSTWTQLSGPATAAIVDFRMPRTNATLPTPGLYRFRFMAGDGQVQASKDIEVRLWPSDMQNIFHTIPGKVEAENYLSTVDEVGHHQVRSYGDTLYRKGSRVDVSYTLNDTSGYSTTNLYQGEWLAYNVDVVQTNQYLAKIRYATTGGSSDGGIIHLEIDGNNVSGPITLPYVGNSLEGYGSVTAGVGTLTAGHHVMKIVMDQAPPAVVAANPTSQILTMGVALNYVEFTSDNESTTPSVTPGDANADGSVDGIDYVIWLNHYDTTTSSGASVGDFNNDTHIDGIDYVIWLNNYSASLIAFYGNIYG